MRENRSILFRGPDGEVQFPVEPPAPPLPNRGMLDKLSAVVREMYMVCYRDHTGKVMYGVKPIAQYDGGADPHGRIYPNAVWPDVAATIVGLQADPLAYVKAQFLLATASRPPTPKQLCSVVAAANWEQYRSQVAAQLGRQLIADQNALQAASDPMIVALGWGQDRAFRYCLLSTAMANLTPLYRYCFGAYKGFQDVATRFREQAMLQYVFQQSAYDESWGSFVPLELQQTATELRLHLVGGSQCHRG